MIHSKYLKFGTTWFMFLFLFTYVYQLQIFRKNDINFAKIDWAVFDLSLLLYFYHQMTFTLMNNIRMSITKCAGPILMKLVSIPMFSRLGF